MTLDVLYAPALPELDAVRSACAAVDKPVNALAGGAPGATVAMLPFVGAARHTGRRTSTAHVRSEG